MLAGAAVGAGFPEAMFWVIALAAAAASIYATRVRLHQVHSADEETAVSALPQASGLPPRFD